MADASSIPSPPSSAQRLATSFGYERLTRLLAKPRASRYVALLALALTLPSVSMGLAADDYILAGQVAAHPLGGYVFESRNAETRKGEILASRDTGYSPWWVDENFHLAFLRPLSSLSLAVDFALWPHAPWWMHLENALLFAGVVVLVASLYRRLGLSVNAAGLALWCYALKPDQAMSTGWISGRNTLLAAAFGLLTLWFYVRSTEMRRGAARWVAAGVASFACALLSAEIGVSAFAYLLAYAATLQQGPLRARTARLWPYTLLVAVWYFGHRLGGYGSVGSGFYIDPGETPLRFAVNLLTGVPIYLATQLTWPFASLSSISATALAVVTLVSVLLLALLWRLFWPLVRTDRRARFFGLGALMSVAPLGCSLPLDRLAYFIGFGTCGLLAMVVTQRFAVEDTTRPRFGARLLYHIHALWMPLLYVPMMFGAMGQVLGGGTMALERALPRDGTRGVVLVNGPSHLPVSLQKDMREYYGTPIVPAIDMLYAGSAPVSVQRTSERTLELEVEPGYLANPFERVSRDPTLRPFRPGDVVDLPRMRVSILAVNQDGAPTRVRFDFKQDVSSSEALWMSWQADGPKPWPIPAVGEIVLLPGIAAI